MHREIIQKNTTTKQNKNEAVYILCNIAYFMGCSVYTVGCRYVTIYDFDQTI